VMRWNFFHPTNFELLSFELRLPKYCFAANLSAAIT